MYVEGQVVLDGQMINGHNLSLSGPLLIHGFQNDLSQFLSSRSSNTI